MVRTVTETDQINPTRSSVSTVVHITDTSFQCPLPLYHWLSLPLTWTLAAAGHADYDRQVLVKSKNFFSLLLPVSAARHRASKQPQENIFAESRSWIASTRAVAAAAEQVRQRARQCMRAKSVWWGCLTVASVSPLPLSLLPLVPFLLSLLFLLLLCNIIISCRHWSRIAVGGSWISVGWRCGKCVKQQWEVTVWVSHICVFFVVYSVSLWQNA